MEPVISISLERKSSAQDLKFNDQNGQVISDPCTVEVMIDSDAFKEGNSVNYIIKLKVRNPDLEFDNGNTSISESHFNINSERRYTFSFRLVSRVSLEDLKTNFQARLIAEVINIDNTDRKRNRRINLDNQLIFLI